MLSKSVLLENNFLTSCNFLQGSGHELYGGFPGYGSMLLSGQAMEQVIVFDPIFSPFFGLIFSSRPTGYRVSASLGLIEEFSHELFVYFTIVSGDAGHGVGS